MHRRVRSFVALCAAYALVFAALMGALGSARAAMPDGFQLCIAGTSSDGPVPARAEHELCCVLCVAGGQPALAGGSIAPLADALGRDVSVLALAPVLRQFERLSSARHAGLRHSPDPAFIILIDRIGAAVTARSRATETIMRFILRTIPRRSPRSRRNVRLGPRLHQGLAQDRPSLVAGDAARRAGRRRLSRDREQRRRRRPARERHERNRRPGRDSRNGGAGRNHEDASARARPRNQTRRNRQARAGRVSCHVHELEASAQGRARSSRARSCSRRPARSRSSSRSRPWARAPATGTKKSLALTGRRS